MHIPIPPKISATISFNSQWRNHSIFKNFCRASSNGMEPSWCTLSLVESFPKTPRTLFEASQFGGSHNYKTKQNKTNLDLPSQIDKRGVSTRVFFFFPNLWSRWVGNRPREELAKFGEEAKEGSWDSLKN